MMKNQITINNNSVLFEVNKRLEDVTKNSNVETYKIRSISSTVFKLIDNKSIANILLLCEKLLEKRKWEYGVIAYDWAFRIKTQYSKDTFLVFERWLKTYVTGWGDCDDFCTHAFGELLSQYNSLFPKVVQWTEHPDFCVRRAAAVILIYPIKKMRFDELEPFTIVDSLMNDEHDLVLKGYGWMLKIYSTVKPDEVYHYVKNNKMIMPRVSFRYAIEKYDDFTRKCLMQKN